LTAAPAVYYEGDDILSRRFAKDFTGDGLAAFVVEKAILDKYRRRFAGILSVKPVIIFFGGECSLGEVGRLEKSARAAARGPVKAIFAAGGGKAIDASKILAARLGARLAAIPTSTATCAAFTSIAPTYFSDGTKRKTLDMAKAPDVCAADYGVLIRQPARLVAAGIADAVAKYYETSAYVSANPAALTNPSVRAAFALTTEIMRLASECVAGAVDAVSKGKVTRDFRRSIYLNLVLPGLVSGIGGKKCRAVAAHALCNGLGHAPEARGSLHGERVGWGLLVQLMLEGKKKDARRLKIFLNSVGAPTTLGVLGIADPDGAGIKKALAVASSSRESMRFLGRKISRTELAGAVRAVERI